MFKIRRTALLLLAGIVTAAFLNAGTVRKNKNAILKTQTDPIKLKDKMEELKDGEKGPATPVFTWYGGGNKFMSAQPFETAKAPPQPPPDLANKVSEVDFEEVKMEEPSEAEEPAVEEPGFEPEMEEKDPESLFPIADKGEDTETTQAAKADEQAAVPGETPDDASEDKDWWDAI